MQKSAGRRPATRWDLLGVAFCLQWLAGCGSLPMLVPDLAQPSIRTVSMQDARGPLMAEQTRALLAGLERRSPDTGIFDEHLAREQAINRGPLTTGNSVRLLQDGPATYQAMLEAIQGARHHINLETYILDDDEVGRRFAQALIDKRSQGVEVNLIRDSVGTLGTSAAFFQRLSDSGIRVLEFNPVNPLSVRAEWVLNRRDHRKLLIVDGRIDFLGGINISSVYSGGSFSKGWHPRPAGTPAWRDTDLRLQGPVVAELQKLFLEAWRSQGGAPLPQADYLPPAESAGHEVVRAIGSSPEEPFSQMYVTLLSAIASARRSVHLTNAYFVPDPLLLEMLEAAAGRGVDVCLILPSQTDSWLVFHAGRSFYERLLKAGVKIFERHGVILHSKTVLVDGVWSTVGSTNLDWRSFVHNHELDAVVLGADFGRQLQALFAADLAASDAIMLEQWRRRPLQFRLKEGFARLWAYWL
jgi:cardiolipin synthase A/B